MNYTGQDSGNITFITTLPADNTTPDAADVNVPFETAFDNFANIRNRLERLELGYLVWTYDVEEPGAGYVWKQYRATTYEDPPAGQGHIEFVAVQPGDWLFVQASIICENQGVATSPGSRIRLAAVDGLGVAPTGDIAVPGARAYITPSSGAVHVTLIGRHMATTAGNTRVKIQGRVNASGEFMRVQSVVQLIGHHVRET